MPLAVVSEQMLFKQDVLEQHKHVKIVNSEPYTSTVLNSSAKTVIINSI